MTFSRKLNTCTPLCVSKHLSKICTRWRWFIKFMTGIYHRTSDKRVNIKLRKTAPVAEWVRLSGSKFTHLTALSTITFKLEFR